MLKMTAPPSELLYLPIIHLDGAFIFRELNGESWVNEKRKGIHSLLAWKHMPPEHATINLIKRAKALNDGSFESMTCRVGRGSGDLEDRPAHPRRCCQDDCGGITGGSPRGSGDPSDSF